MKSERRHDLETNDLAVRLRSGIESTKPYFVQILGGVAVVALLIAVWTAWGRSSSVLEQEAWDKFILASYTNDPEMLDMKRLAEDSQYSGTSVPEWAYLMWCDRQLLIASQTYLVDRSASMSRLKQIQGILEGLVSGASVPQIKDRARYSLAQVHEMQDKLDEAEEYYQEVNGNLAVLAADRSEQLEDEEVKQAWNWLVTAELPKRPANDSSNSPLSSRPSFEAEVPKTTSPPASSLDTRSLEEILTGGSGGGSDIDRYESSDDSATGAKEDNSDEPLSDEDSVENPSDGQ